MELEKSGTSEVTGTWMFAMSRYVLTCDPKFEKFPKNLKKIKKELSKHFMVEKFNGNFVHTMIDSGTAISKEVTFLYVTTGTAKFNRKRSIPH